MQFSDTTNKDGLVELIEDYTGTQSATTSSYSLVKKTRDINNALNYYMMIAIKAEGRWQVDDTNQTDYPRIFGDLVSSQQDYSFTVDEQGNQILDIYKVRIKDNNGIWRTLEQRDITSMNDEPLDSTVPGIPSKYDITANGIFLTVIPDYSSDNGLEIYTSRTPSYFLSTDTTKKPGFRWTHHEYLALRPSFFYALSNGLPQTVGLKNSLDEMEKMIISDYSRRNKDEQIVLQPINEINYI